MSELICQSVCFGSVLHDVNLVVQRGRVTALIGPSGAGKTTLLSLLAGLEQPTRGSITRPNGRIGMVFQDSALWEHLTVQQHLSIVGASPQRIEQILQQMQIASLRDRLPGHMSGGERRRLAIARALAIDPAWLLLDEPMAHLDGPARQQLYAILRSAITSSTAGILIATHHAEEAMRLADNMAVMVEGRIVQQGAPHQVYGEPVNLTVARTLGPAGELRGRILRPHQIRFHVDAEGDATVRRCEFAGSHYHVLIECADTILSAVSTEPYEPGTRVTLDVA